MNFGAPVFLPLLALLPLVLLVMAWAARRRRAMLLRIGDPALVRRLSDSVNWRGRWLRDSLWVLALAMVILALARPQWGTESQPVEQRGVQVMVALDVSNSMLAEDIRPNRLLRAKLEIADLMDRLNGDEIGLVLFSGAAFIQFPLTSDYNTARTFLESADTRSISRQGTVIGEAIRIAMTGFDPDLASQRVIVIVTDGETHDVDSVAAAEEAAAQGVTLYTVGFGSAEGSPIPEIDQFGQQIGFKVDDAGQTVISRLDEATLQQIATVGNGTYFNAGEGGVMQALAAELDQLQAGEIESRTAFTYIERFQYFLLVGFVALAAAELVPDRKGTTRRRLIPALRIRTNQSTEY